MPGLVGSYFDFLCKRGRLCALVTARCRASAVGEEGPVVDQRRPRGLVGVKSCLVSGLKYCLGTSEERDLQRARGLMSC